MRDEQIVALYLERDEEALSVTKNLYGKRLCRLSFQIVQNEEDAQECENDTYLAAWNSIPPKEPWTYFFSYLAKITRNISVNLYHKNHTQKRFAHVVELTREMEECIPNPNDEKMNVEDSVLTDAVGMFLFSLQEEEREIFMKRYWYAHSVSEIAVDYHFSQSKVKSKLMRTRNKLKKYFESEGIRL